MLKAKYSKPETCKECPLYEKGQGFVPDALGRESLLSLVGEAPGRNEVIKGEPFVGKEGFVLKHWGLRAVPSLQLLLEQGHIYLGKTLRCLPPENNGRHYPIGETRTLAEQHCRRYDVWNSSVPSSGNASPCLLLGEMPQRYWFRHELSAEDTEDRRAGRKCKGILGRIGRVYERDGRKWIFGPHPAWVLRQPALVEHLQTALRITAAEVEGHHSRLDIRVLRDSSCLDGIPDSDVGLDLETDANGKISIFGISWDQGRSARAFSTTHENSEQVRQFLQRSSRLLVGHNILAFDLPKLRAEGIIAADLPQLQREGLLLDAPSVQQPFHLFDTMLALHATHAHLAGLGSYDLRSLVLLYGQQRKPAEWFPLDWKDYSGDIWRTCAVDAAASLFCSVPLRAEIRREGLEATVEISHKVAPIFQQMHEKGVKLDVKVLEAIHKEREEQRAQLEAALPKVHKRKKFKRKPAVEWDESINPRSPDIIEYLHNIYGISIKGRSRADFEHLLSDRTLPSNARILVEQIISLSKLGSDAFWIGKTEETDDGISFSKLDKDGFCHPEYQLTGSPDRPTCTGTNVQNFPRPHDDPRRVPLRGAVIPPAKDMVLVSSDFSHIESFTNAIEAGDWERVKALQEGRLSHEATAELINSRFGLSLTRQQGKTCNHAFDKGESGYNLARRLFGTSSNPDVARAESIIQAMLSDFPRTKAFRQKLWSDSRNNPYIATNSFGRRLLCFGVSKYGEDDDSRRQGEAVIRDRWKKALAFLGRSSAIDVLLRVMAKIYYEARLDEWSLPYIEIHDELVYAVPEDCASRYASIIKEAFEEPVPELGNISLPCQVSIGRNWSEAK